MIKINQTIQLVGLVIILGLSLAWWLNRPATSTSPVSQVDVNTASKVKLVSPAEFAQLAKDDATFMVDVHIPAQTQIPGTDAVIPYDRVQSNLDKLPADKSTPILVYCRSGSMSARAAEEIAELGYTQVYDLEGGTDAYKQSQAAVMVTPAEQDLGTVVYGDVATTTFTLTNYTPQPLQITRVSTSCGCTKATVEKEQLAAYESIPVTVTFDPAVHKDDTDLGELTRTIYLETDHPDFPQLENTLIAEVIKK